jgi:hypothetical protein
MLFVTKLQLRTIPMSQIEKLLARFMTKPKDLTWQDLLVILKFYDYEQLAPSKTGGSRVKFADRTNHVITLHRPHPNPIVKRYVIEQLITTLKENGKI